jgi:hypothetical protein
MSTAVPAGRVVLMASARRLYGVEKSVRVGPKPRDDIGILEQEVAGLWEHVAEEPRLARPSGSRQDDGRKVPDRFQNLRFQLAPQVSHE